jgi:type I restriction enzyme, S subunit
MLQGYLTHTDEAITKHGLDSSSAKLLPVGTVLLSIFATIGRTATLGIEAATNQAIVGVIPKKPDVLDLRYLEYCLRHKAEEWKRKARGVAQLNINGKILKSTKIPLPPLAEQKRIAGILDAADALRAKRRESIEQLDALIQSTFLEMFGDPDQWVKVKVQAVALEGRGTFTNGPFGSNLLTRELTSEGVPVIYIRDLSSGEYNRVSKVFVTSSKSAQLLSCHVQPGDLLLCKVGDPPGTAAVYPEGEPQGVISQDVIRLCPDQKKANSTFLAAYFNSEYGKRAIKQITVEATRARFGLRDLKSQDLPLPPLDVQNRLATLLEYIQKQRDSSRLHFSELDTLFASLQSQAFSGAL